MQRATAAMAALLKGAEGPDDGNSRVERVRATLDAMFSRGGIRARRDTGTISSKTTPGECTATRRAAVVVESDFFSVLTPL